MKKALDFLMSNKYIIIVFAAIVFGLKLLFGYYDIPENYLPWFEAATTVFLTLFITAVIHLFSFFILAWVTKNQSKPWWEEKGGRGDRLFNFYAQGLIVSLPLVIYGTLLYFAVFASWINILIIAAIFTISRFIKQMQNNKRQQWQREL